MERLLDLLHETKRKDIQKIKNQTDQSEQGKKYQQCRKELYLSLLPSQDVLLKHYEEAIRDLINDLEKNLYSAGAKAGITLALSLLETDDTNIL